MTTYNLNVGGVDVSGYVGSLSWSDNIDTLGVELTFNIAREYYDNTQLGDGVVLSINAIPYFLGVVVSRNISEYTTSVTCYDFAWYLNKSTVLKQFKLVKGDDAIKQLCEEIGVEVEVKGVDVVIDKIYKDKTVINVIRDILDKATQKGGKRYNLYMRGSTVVIEPFSKVIVNGKYKLTDDDIININDHIGTINYSDSVVELKNSIKVVSGDDKAVRYLGEAKDNESIKTYGMLQEVVTLDAKDFANAKNIAKNKLKELNKITQDISLDMLGDMNVKAGKVLNLLLLEKNLLGEYLIKSSSHTIDNGIHKVNVVVEVYRYE